MSVILFDLLSFSLSVTIARNCADVDNTSALSAFFILQFFDDATGNKCDMDRGLWTQAEAFTSFKCILITV